ncbi:MAG TPA: septum formation initiator family protein [Bacilli bacterium]|nr:septum formation initiator family protein [Bacilli bacterium]
MANSKNRKKRLKRILLFGTIFVLIDCAIIYAYASTWGQIYAKKKESSVLTQQLETLKEDKKDLKTTVEKLNDPEYMAKYAREKRLYSGKNEYIIRIK